MAALPGSPVVAFTDWDELGIDRGTRLLSDAGWTVRTVGSLDPDLIASVAGDATAVCVANARLDRELISRLPQLRIIATVSAGVDCVDLDAAREAGIWVANLPDVATEEVAVHTIAMALALIRQLPSLDREVRAGGWRLRVDDPPRATQSMTLGLLGLGRIGRRVGELGQAIFERVLGYDPWVGALPASCAIEQVDRRTLLERSDVLSLHLGYEPGASAEIDAAAFAAMRPGAILLNMSRGRLVDSDALLRALDDGNIAAAGLDVIDPEPPPRDHPLIGHAKVLLTPHSAFLSERTVDAYPEGQARNILAWERDGRPLTPVFELDAR